MKRNSAYNYQDKPRKEIIAKIVEGGTEKGTNYNLNYGKYNIEPNNEIGKVI